MTWPRKLLGSPWTTWRRIQAWAYPSKWSPLRETAPTPKECSNRVRLIFIWIPRTFINNIISVPNSVCMTYSRLLLTNKPPHVILDTTVSGLASETVKSLSSALGIPTVSGSFGQEGDLRQWRDISPKKRNYLLQVSRSVIGIST